MPNGLNYVLVSAARNEEQYIERILRSVVTQTITPARWVIVSDGSTDKTDQIVRRYAREFEFIGLLSLAERHGHDFAAKVHAVDKGIESFAGLAYKFLGNLDADISFESTYFERLLAKFDQNSRLGLAGGYICEEQRGAFRPRTYNNPRSVPHAVQFFRAECFDQIGRYIPLPYGGEDWYAEVRCRMAGWEVQSFPDLPVHHHRPTGGAEFALQSWFRQGKMDFSMGSHPIFELAKVSRRILASPFFLGALTRFGGYVAAACSHDPRMIDDNVVTFVRTEEMKRLRRCLNPTLLFAGGRSSRTESAKQVPTP
jgi:poly-beta-1,6-N-acetyl-D-glucosamine synthase